MDVVVLLVVLGVVGVQRVAELFVSRRNERRLLGRGGVRAPRDGFGLIVAVHAAFFALLPVESSLAGWAGVGVHTPLFLAVAALATALRYWSAARLGPRYTVRVIRLPGAPLVAAGPYRWLRHPIYLAVAVELAALPLAFAAYATALLVGGLHAVALGRRIRFEEAHLSAAG